MHHMVYKLCLDKAIKKRTTSRVQSGTVQAEKGLYLRNKQTQNKIGNTSKIKLSTAP